MDTRYSPEATAPHPRVHAGRIYGWRRDYPSVALRRVVVLTAFLGLLGLGVVLVAQAPHLAQGASAASSSSKIAAAHANTPASLDTVNVTAPPPPAPAPPIPQIVEATGGQPYSISTPGGTSANTGSTSAQTTGSPTKHGHGNGNGNGNGNGGPPVPVPPVPTFPGGINPCAIIVCHP